MRIKLLVLPLILAFGAYGQEGLRGLVKLDFQVPQPTSNKAFKESFTGIMDLSGSLCLSIRGFNFGGFYRYKQFQVQANKIANITTVQMVNGAGLRLGYDHWISDKSIFSSSINIGYNWISYNRVSCQGHAPAPFKETGISLEPNANIYFLIDDGFGIGLMASYHVLTYAFDPAPICLDQFHTYNDSDKQGLTQGFSFGFCVYYDLAREASSDY